MKVLVTASEVEWLTNQRLSWQPVGSTLTLVSLFFLLSHFREGLVSYRSIYFAPPSMQTQCVKYVCHVASMQF